MNVKPIVRQMFILLIVAAGIAGICGVVSVLPQQSNLGGSIAAQVSNLTKG